MNPEIALQGILNRLHGVRRNGSGWMSLCPAHLDKNPSLSVNERDGKILLKCFAGCRTEAICEAAGIEMRELFSDNSSSAPHIVAEYDYVDENGKRLYQVLRYEPKGFKQRRPNGNGGWHWNLNGTRRVIYRLPEVIAAKSVIVCEGEKDCETARALGLVATCNAGGAGKWTAEYSEPLRGKRVAIIADADRPGREHAQRLAASLSGKAESIKVLEFANAKDLAEWVAMGGKRDALLELIHKRPEWKPAEQTRPIPGVLASEVEPETVRWLWANYIPLGKITLFDGDPDEGKSLVTVDLAARLTRGCAMSEESRVGCPAAGAVIVTLEDGLGDTIRPRLEAAGAVLHKVRLIDTIKGADGVEHTPVIPDDLPAIEAAIQSVNAKLLVLDPLVGTLDQDTNSYRDQDIRRALAPVKVLAERLGVAVVCIRHLTKGGGQNPKYRGGGSIGIIGAARAAFLFADAPEQDDVHVIAPVKGNLRRGKPPALEYGITEKNEQPVIAWHGQSNHSAHSLIAQPESAEESNALTDARNFLVEYLQDGPRDAKGVKREAKQAGVCDRTLYRAKAALGIVSQKSGIGDGQHWQWELPKIAKKEDLATFEQVSEIKPVTSISSPKIAKSGNLATLNLDDGNLGNLRGPESDGYTPDQEGPGCTCRACDGHFGTVAGWRAHVARGRCRPPISDHGLVQEGA